MVGREGATVYSSQGELRGQRCKRRAITVQKEHGSASRQQSIDGEVYQADGRGGLTDAAGRSKVQSRDFVVVMSATRVDWLAGRSSCLTDACFCLRVPILRWATRRVEAPSRYTKVLGEI